MSYFTTELRYVCETYAGFDSSKEHPDIPSIIEASLPKIFDFNFPIFDEDYRSVLEHKIIMHFYFREIGAETVGLWKSFLQKKLNEIMPYYNKLYASELLEFNPFDTVDYKIIHSGTDHNVGSSTGSENSSSSSNRTGTRNAENKNAYSDTPQGQLSGVDTNTYLTDYRKINDSSTDSASGTSTGQSSSSSSMTNDGTNAFERRIFGKLRGDSYADLLMKFRKTFLNIDMLIIGELESLFMSLWE